MQQNNISQLLRVYQATPDVTVRFTTTYMQIRAFVIRGVLASTSSLFYKLHQVQLSPFKPHWSAVHTMNKAPLSMPSPASQLFLTKWESHERIFSPPPND